MRSARFTLLAAVVVAIAFSSCVSIAEPTVVTVTPDTMAATGWILATQAANPGGSPHPSFRMAGPGLTPAGTGSFHFDTEQITGVDPIQKIYLGTNNYSGVALSQITTFKYYTYLDRRGYDGAGGSPDGQPPIVEIITDSGRDATTVQQRRFVFRPWGWWGGHNVAKNTWQEWDMMADLTPDRWQMVGSNASTNVSGDWSWVKTRYTANGPMTFSTPLVGDYRDYYTDFKYGNQSGTSISIRVGATKASDYLFNQDTMKWVLDGGAWRESCWISGYADKLVIGVDGVETVYDFEKGTAMVLGIGSGACRDSIMAAASQNFFFAVFGQVLADPAPTTTDFYLDDGSGKKIRVIAPNQPTPGDYVRAKGTLEWNSSVSRYDLKSAFYDVVTLN